MKRFALIKDGVVAQTQPNASKGFVEVDKSVTCGMLYDGENFTQPSAAPPSRQKYSAAAQSVLDMQAQSMGYDSIFTAVSYEGDAHQKFNDEAVALKAWRSDVWVAAYALLADVESGGVAQPTVNEFVAGLPAFGG